jgi:hypothetical protein
MIVHAAKMLAVAFATLPAVAFAEAANDWLKLSKAVHAHAVKFGKPVPNKFSYAFEDLNGDGRLDAVVLENDPRYCGTGGCTLLIFRGTRSGFTFVSGSTISNEPIRVSRETKNGWKTLLITVRGGGILTPEIHALKFDGLKYQYPLNPSVQDKADQSELSESKVLVFH